MCIRFIQLNYIICVTLNFFRIQNKNTVFMIINEQLAREYYIFMVGGSFSIEIIFTSFDTITT